MAGREGRDTGSGARAVLALPGALIAALGRAPVAASGDPLWPPRRHWRSLAPVALLATLALGLAGGSIALFVADLRVAPLVGTVLGVAQCAPLLLAVRWPLLAWRIMVAALLAGELALAGRQVVWPWPVTSVVALVVVLALLVAYAERRTALGAGAATVLLVAAPAPAVSGTPAWVALILAALVAAVMLVGDAVRGRYAAEASLAEQAELRRRDLARQAVLEERTRIARELHDVVAHHMSVVAIQAEAAPYKIAGLQPEAQGTFEVIRDAAREALAETRRVVGLLREDTESPERVPQPGLDRLAELAAAGRRTGLTIEVSVVGIPRPVAAGVDVSAFRIVQEGLSNAARYAPGARVRVEVRYAAAAIRLTVADDGGSADPDPDPERGPAAGAGSGGGHGLVGMRERVAMLGGTLTAGPGRDGGFAVTADLPYGEKAKP
jgi:signal transduction histidine kinase